jgi:hypothetical protein
MKLKIDRIISIATLITSLGAIVLVLKRPAPVAQPQSPQAIEEHARSFDEKMAQFNNAANPSQPDVTANSQSSDTQASTRDSAGGGGGKAEAHINSDEINAVLAQALGTAGLTPDSNIGTDAPPIKDQRISFDGDLVHGQFLTEIAGKDVWITISGHIGEQGGYATFDPTEFKVGDLDVPVSLVNPALQKKLLEQRDRLKLPDNVGGLKVDNSQLVMQGK